MEELLLPTSEASPFLLGTGSGAECPHRHQPTLWNYPCEATWDNPASLTSSGRPLWRQSQRCPSWPGAPALAILVARGSPYLEFAGRANMRASSPTEPCLVLQGHTWISALDPQDWLTGCNFVASDISSILPPSGNHHSVLCFMSWACFVFVVVVLCSFFPLLLSSLVIDDFP